MVGWDARGANAFAIDPKNARRVIGVAGNSLNWESGWGASPHGLYLSTDKAGSWRHVLASEEGFSGAVAFDPASYDTAKGYCTRAYYLTNGKGLYRSDDGGETWRVISEKAVVHTPSHDWTEGGTTPALLRVDTHGTVYAGGVEGVLRSTDGGKTFERCYEKEVAGLALAPDDAVYVSGGDGIALSRDGGKNWGTLPGRGLEAREGRSVNGLVISPADPRRMLCWVALPGFNWPRFVSTDGGATWRKVTLDNTGAVLPANGRQGYATWSPNDPAVAWSIGGDWVTRSTDGGATFRWSNNGYNGVMVGGMFNFAARHPNTVFLGFQDYNGAFTTDGGKTWNYRDVSGKGWGGQEYGGIAVDDLLMVCGDAESWGTPRHLRLSRDGGTTWGTVNGPDGKPLEFHGADISYADPADGNIVFASDLRSGDHGATWQRMTGCDGVFTANPVTHALYGRKGNDIVRSTDHGITWTVAATVSGGFGDMALDQRSGRIYVASEDKLKAWDGKTWTVLETPRDQFGNSRVWTVTTDPKNPSIVYVGGPRNTYATSATVCRSTDGGKTWRNLTVTTPLGKEGEGGPHEVACIRVHPVTREAWIAGQCYGLWRIAPPAPGEEGLPATAASAPRATTPPALAVTNP